MAAGVWRPRGPMKPPTREQIAEILKMVSARKAQTSHGKFKFSKKKKNIQRRVPVRQKISLTKNYYNVKEEPSENNITASENNITTSPKSAKKGKTTGGKRGRPADPLWYWNYGRVQKKGKKTGIDNSEYKKYLQEAMKAAAAKWEGTTPGHGRSCRRK